MIKTHVKDKGYKKIRQQLKSVDDSFVEIGIHEDAGQYKDGTRIVDVAFWNEYGTKRIPARPFIRSTAKEGRRKFKKLAKYFYLKMIASKGKFSAEKALDGLGFNVSQAVKNKILNIWKPPNAPSTLARKKGRGKPLVDSWTLFRSIAWKTTVNSKKSSRKQKS